MKKTLEQLMLEDAGAGLSNDPADNLYWFDVDDRDYRWCEALFDVDFHEDKTELLKLLRSDDAPSPLIRRHIADLLERYQLKHPPGKRRTPSYDRTAKQWALERAVARVREDVVKRGVRVSAACEKHAEGAGVPAGTLENAYSGRLGAFTRIGKSRTKKRLQP